MLDPDQNRACLGLCGAGVLRYSVVLHLHEYSANRYGVFVCRQVDAVDFADKILISRADKSRKHRGGGAPARRGGKPEGS